MIKRIRALMKKSMVLKITVVISVIITVSFLCVSLVVCVISAIASISKEKQIIELYMHNALIGVDNKIKDMARVSLIAFSDDITQDILQNIERYSDAQKEESADYLQKLYTNLISLRKDIQGVYLFNENELVFHQTIMNFTIRADYKMAIFIDSLKEIEAQPAFTANNYHIFVAGPPGFLRYTPYNNLYEDTYMYIIRGVKTFSPNERIGHIVLAAPVSTLREAVAEHPLPYFSFLLFSHNKTVMYSDNADLPGKNADAVTDIKTELVFGSQPAFNGGSYYGYYKGKKSLVSYQSSRYSGITLLTAVPLIRIYRNTILLSLLFIFLFFIVIYAVIMLTGKYTKAVMKPVILLSETMSNFSREDIRLPLPIDREDEAGRLSEAFNAMLATIKDLIFQEYEKTISLKNIQLKNKETQLRYLYAQINPHFLYNTLDNIRIKAALAGNDEVANMIMLLVDFFRGNVETASHFVPVKKEIDLIRAYLELMRCRYPKLESEFNIDQSLLDMEIPSFVLQPIVENSLLHGLKTLNYSGKITISLHRETDTTVLLTVADNGAGFDAASRSRISAILEGPETDAPEEETHIGIANVVQRLKMFYSGNCGLSYKENSDGGVTAIIRMSEKCGETA